MPLPNSDRALRRMAADLAALHADDAAAILGELTAAERAKIEVLLSEYTDGPQLAPPPPPAPVKECDIAQLSPWLAERVRAELPQGISMTREAHQLLRNCAVELYPAPAGPAPSGPGRLARMARRAMSIMSLSR